MVEVKRAGGMGPERKPCLTRADGAIVLPVGFCDHGKKITRRLRRPRRSRCCKQREHWCRDRLPRALLFTDNARRGVLRGRRNLHSRLCGEGVRRGAFLSGFGPAPPPQSPLRRWSPAPNDKVVVGEDDHDPPIGAHLSRGPVRANLTIAGTEAFVGLGKPVEGKGPC